MLDPTSMAKAQTFPTTPAHVHTYVVPVNTHVAGEPTALSPALLKITLQLYGIV
jgi:hypothetical protein